MGLLDVLVCFLAGVPGSAPGTDGWLLVRGDPDRIGSLSWQRIGEAYLSSIGADWETVPADDADRRPETSRLVVGTAANHALVARLAPGLGLEWAGGELRFEGRQLGPGTGLVLVTDDPDGGGLLSLFTGSDPDGVFACFTTTADFLAVGSRVIEAKRPAIDTSSPRVVRLDLDFEHLMASAKSAGPRELALRIARGLVGYHHVFDRIYDGRRDLLDSMSDLLSDHGSELQRARDFFAGRDLTAEVLEAYRLGTEAIGARSGPQPIYYIVYGPPGRTNAQTFDPDPITQRPQVLLNLTSLTEGRHFESAAVHETIHTLQDLGGERLVDRAINEGVASFAAQELLGGLSNGDALFWNEEQLAAADARRTAIVETVLALAQSTNRSEHAPYMLLGAHPAAVPGAPSRTAYYVALVACQAWREKNPDRPLSDLLSVSADEVFAALD